MRVLKDLLSVHKPKILGLLEPRVSGEHADTICKKIKFENWVRVEAVGFSGGIWVFWTNDCEVEIFYTHPQFIVLKLKCSSDESWFLAVVYGNPNVGLRQKLWHALVLAKLRVESHLLVVRDFNAVVSDTEVNTQGPLTHSRNAGFQEWIFELGLIDLGFSGPMFTWVRGLHDHTFKGARLDRALCNFEWRSRFTESYGSPSSEGEIRPLAYSSSATRECSTFKI